MECPGWCPGNWISCLDILLGQKIWQIVWGIYFSIASFHGDLEEERKKDTVTRRTHTFLKWQMPVLSAHAKFLFPVNRLVLKSMFTDTPSYHYLILCLHCLCGHSSVCWCSAALCERSRQKIREELHLANSLVTRWIQSIFLASKIM